MESNSICMSSNVIVIQKEFYDFNENVPIIQPFFVNYTLTGWGFISVFVLYQKSSPITAPAFLFKHPIPLIEVHIISNNTHYILGLEGLGFL